MDINNINKLATILKTFQLSSIKVGDIELVAGVIDTDPRSPSLEPEVTPEPLEKPLTEYDLYKTLSNL